MAAQLDREHSRTMQPFPAVRTMTLRSQLQLPNFLCFALYSTSRAMTELYRGYLDQADLTYPQFLVLFVLWNDDGCPINSIRDALALEGGTVTPLLKRMEKRGLLQRRRSAADERVVNIHLTARGRALETTLMPTVAKGMLCDLAMSPEQVARMAAQLRTVRTTIEEVIARREPTGASRIQEGKARASGQRLKSRPRARNASKAS